MNVVHGCRVCLDPLDANEQVVGVTRDVPRQTTRSLVADTEPENGYVHPEHERSAAALGYRRVATGTLMELERRRNPALFK